MQISIFDVAHGFCALVVADTGNTILVDCGHNEETGFYPSSYLRSTGRTRVERFFVTNYDEDHVSGLWRLKYVDQISVGILNRNPTITPSQLRALKQKGGPLGLGMSALFDMLGEYTSLVTTPPNYGYLQYEVFYNSYPAFQDTNNLSQVLFLNYPGLSIVFPGDLEGPGWKALLQNVSFRQHLGRVNVFVASHHGRESGYDEGVFQVCEPEIVIISDEEKQYETQETDYGLHAKGVAWDSGDRRFVLTTRKDGMITISANVFGPVRIQTSKG